MAVVVVGSNGEWESEGHDRPDLSLPGRQRELVEAVLDVNPRTVVVVNAGSPVEMPWAERAAAVLMVWYPGRGGRRCTGRDHCGRLRADRAPARHLPGPRRRRAGGSRCRGRAVPGLEGTVVYGEGVLVGYRFFETSRLAPRFPFGFGLSYGELAFEEVTVTPDLVTVRLKNTGPRPGTEVVQVYVRALEAPVRRPDRELAGFAKVSLDPGADATVEIALDAEAYRYWDVETHGWRAEAGRYEVLVGASSRDIRASAEVAWRAGPEV